MEIGLALLVCSGVVLAEQSLQIRGDRAFSQIQVKLGSDDFEGALAWLKNLLELKSHGYEMISEKSLADVQDKLEDKLKDPVLTPLQYHEAWNYYVQIETAIINLQRKKVRRLIKQKATIQKVTHPHQFDPMESQMGTMLDSRDGQVYRTIKIGRQRWMAENLNLSIGRSYCYENQAENCLEYGQLYDWKSAMRACPKGWHLPTDKEFDAFLMDEKIGFFGGNDAGSKLKTLEMNGNNNTGFSVLPAGYKGSFDFDALGRDAYFWTSTKRGYSFKVHKLRASASYLSKDNGEFVLLGDDRSKAFSVRCIQDHVRQ